MHLRLKENTIPTYQELSTDGEEDVPDLVFVKDFFRFVFKRVLCLVSLSNG